MFHVEQILATIAISGCILSGVAQAESAQKTVPTLALALSTDSEDSKRETQEGILDLLLGWDESAQLHFQEAIVHDEANALAYAGLCFINPHDEAARACLKRIYEDESTRLLSHETFYIESLLKLAAAHYGAACQDFCARADQYRADKIANVWAVILLHSSDLAYHPETGEPGPQQREALRRIEKLCETYPQDPLISYARAYVEQSAPQISNEALINALQAKDAFPQHPMPQLLVGHLLSRIGQYDEAVKHFQQAAILAAKRGLSLEQSPLWWQARLCESSALWLAGHKEQALKLISTLNSSSVAESSKNTEVSILRRWECNTLPLRFLVAAQGTPTQQAITKASQAATPKTAWKSADYVLHVRDCLRATLSARLKAQQGKWKEAQHSLDLAEQAKECLDKSYDSLSQESQLLLSPWHRAQEACSIAIALAKACVYQDTKHIWLENAKTARKAPNLMMPPVIPAP